jgi:hypothetical protein
VGAVGHVKAPAPVRDPFRDDVDHELRGVRIAKADRRAFRMRDRAVPGTGPLPRRLDSHTRR